MSGRIISWIPKNVNDELINIMKEEKIEKKAEALKKMAYYAKLGKEVDYKNRFGRTFL